jgi:hypothetical protein
LSACSDYFRDVFRVRTFWDQGPMLSTLTDVFTDFLVHKDGKCLWIIPVFTYGINESRKLRGTVHSW